MTPPGIGSALRHVERFGFNRQELPRDLSLALGSANLTPLQLASGYAVLASGGYRTEPYYIQRVQLADGEVLFEADPLVVCEMCETVSPAGPGEAQVHSGVVTGTSSWTTLSINH